MSPPYGVIERTNPCCLIVLIWHPVITVLSRRDEEKMKLSEMFGEDGSVSEQPSLSSACSNPRWCPASWAKVCPKLTVSLSRPITIPLCEPFLSVGALTYEAPNPPQYPSTMKTSMYQLFTEYLLAIASNS